MDRASWWLQFVIPVLALTALMLSHPQTASAQGQCCVCRASNGTTVTVSEQGSCQASCAADGGTAIGGTVACNNGGGGRGGSQGYPAAKYDGPTQCLKSFDGGNCKGNNWCHCGALRVTVVMDEGKEYPAEDATTWEPVHIHVGQTLKFHGIIHYFGGTESGALRVALQKSASIEIFGPDGMQKHSLEIAPDDTPNKNTLPNPSFTYFKQFQSYTFDKPGRYGVYVHVWGAFKWNGNDGSCSYECENGPNTLGAVRTDGSNASLTVIVEANSDANPPK
jgi:hypothetical protein